MSDAPEAISDPMTDGLNSPAGQARVAAASIPADLIHDVGAALGDKAAHFLQVAWVIADPATKTFPLEPKLFAAAIGLTSTSGLNSAMKKLADAGHIELIDKASARLSP